MDRKLDEMKQQYRDIPIPNELDFIVNKTIKQHTKKEQPQMAYCCCCRGDYFGDQH